MSTADSLRLLSGKLEHQEDIELCLLAANELDDMENHLIEIGEIHE